VVEVSDIVAEPALESADPVALEVLVAVESTEVSELAELVALEPIPSEVPLVPPSSPQPIVVKQARVSAGRKVVERG